MSKTPRTDTVADFTRHEELLRVSRQLETELADANAARSEIGPLKALIAEKNLRIEKAERAFAETRAELSEVHETHARIMGEKCPTDEVHCTCVPALRKELSEATARAERAELTARRADIRSGERLSEIDALQWNLAKATARADKAEARIGEAVMPSHTRTAIMCCAGTPTIPTTRR